MYNSNVSNKKVLLVDDEIAIAKLLTLLLKSKGYDVESAISGLEAVSILDHHFDIVILDLANSNYEGFKICQQIKSNPNGQNIPIIVISGNQGSAEQGLDYHLGADDYLHKPFEPEELFARMEVIFRKQSTFIKDGHSHQQFETIAELRHIIDQKLIVPNFQPIYHLKPFKILGFEALSRPQSGTGLSNPEIFFKEALKYGFYFDVEMIAWRKAIKAYQEELCLRGEYLFLNCNPYLVESEKFFEVKDMFINQGFSSQKVFLEITERSAITEQDVFFERLRRYREYGFKIAVDDVGGGYSSLESIVHTRPEVVKIDRHIVNGLYTDPFKRSIIKLIVAFCKENGIISVAEGIESKEDLNLLLSMGVDAAQGYYLCRPKETIAACLP